MGLTLIFRVKLKNVLLRRSPYRRPTSCQPSGRGPGVAAAQERDPGFLLVSQRGQ
jgi:hypothetical protein